MRRPLALLAFVGVSLAWSSSKRHADSLEVSNVLKKRASDECPTSYTTITDLDFDMHCGENQSGWDLIPQDGGDPITKQVDSMKDCMDACATARPLCFGAVFNYDTGTCWFKNNTFTYQSSAAENSTDSHLAVARKSELKGYSSACGHTNGSVYTDNSMNFTIHCDQDIIGADYSPWAAPALNGLFHATSLSDCMDKCTKAQDLCEGVAFNPGMENGYGNCYGKVNINTNPSGFRPTGPLTGGKDVVIHSAVGRIPNIDVQCANNDVISSSDGTGYTLQCDNNRPGNDLTQFHSENLTDCISACDQYNAGGKCLGVVLDLKMKNGWQNCYLKGGIGSPLSAPNYILALQGGTVSSTSSAPTSSPTSGSGDSDNSGNNNNGSDNGDNNGGGSSSKAWIAGPVIGAIAAIALIGVLFWWLQRRKRVAANQQPQELASPPMSSEGRPPPPPLKDQAGNAIYGVPPAAGYGYGQGNGPVDAKYQYGNPLIAPQAVYPGGQTPTHEMEAQARHEMAANYKDRPPVELPASQK